MDVSSWTPILHEVGTIIAAVAAAIAATSSLRNGQRLKNGALEGPRAKRKPRKKKTLKGEPGEEGNDWFSPPDLGSTK